MASKKRSSCNSANVGRPFCPGFQEFCRGCHRFCPDFQHIENFGVPFVEFVLAPQHETSCDTEIQTKKDFKSKFIKQLGSSPITSLTNKDKKKELECIQLYYLTIWTQEQRRRILDLQTLGLQGRCIVFLFELSYIYTPFEIASHTRKRATHKILEIIYIDKGLRFVNKISDSNR